MPSVQKAHHLFLPKDVVVLAISIDGQGERAVAPFMAKHGYTFPSLVDSADGGSTKIWHATRPDHICGES